MPLCAPVGETRLTSYGVKYSKAPLPGPGNIWDYDPDGSQWLHTDAVITIPPKSNSSHFSTTIQNAEGDVLITVTPYINVITRLVIIHNHIVQTCSSYHNIFRTYSYD